jgi:hexokinase
LSRSYQNGPALIGSIFGTGTNGAYIDKTRTIKKLGKEKIALAEESGEYMVVNTEWGAMDNGVSRRVSSTLRSSGIH